MTSTSRRYTLADVQVQELRPTSIGYAVTNVMRDGARRPAPPVVTVDQAHERAAEWFPHADTIVKDDAGN